MLKKIEDKARLKLFFDISFKYLILFFNGFIFGIANGKSKKTY